MKICRMEIIFVCVAALLCICTAFKEKNEEDPEESPSFPPDTHQSQPRFFGIFSKPPENAPKQVRGGILRQVVGNVLHGGAIGFQFEARPLKPVHDIFGHFKKKFIPNRDTIGKPEYELPDEPPKNEHWEEGEEEEWEMKKPEKPDPNSPHWDDIGEEPEGYNTEVPIEEIIQPRKPASRPKRFIESKIYHVPLLFRSNGKPYRVVDRSQNSLNSKERV